MKIAAPISSDNEAEMLLHCGADEFYCGVNTPEWRAHFGNNWWMNRRSPNRANFFDWETLQRVVNMAHAKNVAVHITLNAPFYPKSSIGYLLKLSEKLVAELHVDGFIVSDINLLDRLFKTGLPVRIHLSSLGGCFNAYSVDFYRSMGVKRIILPRQLRLSEMQTLIRRAGPDMEFEVFAVNDGCYFEEGFCQTTHELGPFCLTNWGVVPESPGGPPGLTVDMDRALGELHHYRWYQNNCGSSTQPNGLPNGPCSLCWFGQFRDWGVTSVKIVGREASFLRKMRSLQLVRAVMDAVDKDEPCESIASLARSLRQTPEYCNAGHMCYFRDH